MFANNLEVAGHYAVIDPLHTPTDESEIETGIAISYKVQADYRTIDFKADPLEDAEVFRVQFQFAF